MKEVEFVCVNSNFNDYTKKEDQDKLFENLKKIKKLIVYRQNFKNRDSLAAIINTKSKKEMLLIMREIKKCAEDNNVLVDFIQEVSSDFILAIKNESLENLNDFYKT
jgi:hypothetical protein